jgi:hypothetical protein
MTGSSGLPLDWLPLEETDTRSVAPLTRSWTKMSARPLVSPATRLAAPDAKATKVPTSESVGKYALLSIASTPVLDTDTRVRDPVSRRCTKMSARALVSPLTKLVA